MIKINLADRKQAVADAGAKTGLGALGQGISMDAVKDLPLRKIGLVLAVCIGGYILVGDYEDQLAQQYDVAISKQSAEQSKLQAELAKTKGFEAVKKELDSDEQIMRTKIDTIKQLIADRATPPKLLVAVSNALPDDVWLTDLEITDDGAKFSGVSLGYTQVSTLMKNLNQSAYFTDLDLKGTQKGRDDYGNDVAVFELRAKRR